MLSASSHICVIGFVAIDGLFCLLSLRVQHYIPIVLTLAYSVGQVGYSSFLLSWVTFRKTCKDV